MTIAEFDRLLKIDAAAGGGNSFVIKLADIQDLLLRTVLQMKANVVKGIREGQTNG